MDTIKSKIKWFAPFVDNWDEICRLYDKEKDSGQMTNCYNLIQKCETESRIIDGWVKTSPNTWERDKSISIVV